MDRLEKEVAELKTENINLRETLSNMSTKMDDQASTTNDILLQQQQMMVQVMQHMGISSEPVSSHLPQSKTTVSVTNPKGEKVPIKEGSHKKRSNKEGSHKDKGKGVMMTKEKERETC